MSSSHSFYDPVNSQQVRPTSYTQQQYSNADANSHYNLGYTYDGTYSSNRQGATQVTTKGGDIPQTENHAAAAALSSLGGRTYSGTVDSGSRPSGTSGRQQQAWLNSNSATSQALSSGGIAQDASSSTLYNQGYPSQQRTSTHKNPKARDASGDSMYATNSQYRGQGTNDKSQAQWMQAYSQPQRSSPQPTYRQTSEQSQPTSYRYDNSYNTQDYNQQNPQNFRPQSYNTSSQYTSRQPGTEYQSATTSDGLSSLTSAASQLPLASYEQQNDTSASALPLNVNPIHIYDHRAEQQKKAIAEAEKRLQMEAEEQQRREAQEAEEAEERRRKQAEKEASDARAAAEKAQATASSGRKSAGNAKSKKSTGESSSKPSKDGQPSKKKAGKAKQADRSDETTPQVNTTKPTKNKNGSKPVNEEEEMRAMFLKMREFNARNPAMLAKLWEEERSAHRASQSGVEDPSPAQTPQPPEKQPKASKASKTQVLASNHTESAGREPSTQPQELSQTSKISAVKPNNPWSASVRRSLADSATKWLLSQPQNADKTIRADDIKKILDRNPSYAQLCEALEKYQLKFERSALARHLLAAVPEAKGPGRESMSPQNPLASVELSSISQNVKNTGQKGSLSKTEFVPYEVPVHSSHDDNDIRINAMAAATPVPLATAPKSNVPEVEHTPFKAPANKEEAARKRTFGDLVDLTATVDSDEDEPVLKKVKLPETIQAQSTTLPQGVATGSANVPPASVRTPIPNPMTANGVNTSQHMALNALDSQRMQTPKPAAPPKRSTNLERAQLERMRGQMLVEPIMRDRVARKSRYDPRTIARDVLLATGRHPDMRPLNSHLLGLEKLLGSHGGAYNADGLHGNRSDLATIRWNILDPDPPGVKPFANRHARHSLSVEDDLDADDELAGNTHSIRRSSHAAKHELSGGRSSTVASPAYSNHKPKRGRPRTSLSNSRLNDMSQNHDQKHDHEHGASKSAEKQQSQQNNVNSSEIDSPQRASMGYAAFRTQDQNENVVKKRGRPVGWRKAIHGKDAPKTDESPLPVRQGVKPAKKAIKLKEPQYQVYPCKWEKCSAELHNLETLKKHVVKVHGAPSPENIWTCSWSSCSQTDDASRLTFKDLGEWITHVDSKHIQPIAWKLGDGPRGGQVDSQHHDTESEAYLSDAHGRSVTPVISPALDRPADNPALRNLPKDIQKAKKEMDNFFAHKRAIGLSMDRTGCILANKKRRQGFMDDEDFEDVIEEDHLED